MCGLSAVCILILLNVVIQNGGVLSTCVISIVLFEQLFNFVSIQERTGCSARYCVPCSSLIGCDFGNHKIGGIAGICIGYLYRAQSVQLEFGVNCIVVGIVQELYHFSRNKCQQKVS